MSNKAYYLVLEMSDQMRRSTYEKKVFYEKWKVNGLRRGDTGKTSDAVRDVEWTNVSFDWFDGLSNPAMLFVIKNIVPNLKKYNLLWHWPVSRKSAENRVLKELVEAQVMFRTEVPGIYVMNPVRIWRGNPILCIEETKELLRVHRKPSIDLIKDRRPGAEYMHKTQKDTIQELGVPNESFLSIENAEKDLDGNK